MKKMNQFYNKLYPFLLIPAVLTGCAPKALPEPAAPSAYESENIIQPKTAGLPFDFQVHPEDFSLTFQVEDQILKVSEGLESRNVADWKEEQGRISWRYPDDEIAVSLVPENDYLSVTITSEKEGDHSFTWPSISAGSYYLPLGEGKRVPAADTAWQEYLDGQEFSVLEQLSMPFWIASSGSHLVLFIMENPYRTRLNFTVDSGIEFSVSHEYPKIDPERTNRFRIYVTENNPAQAAKLYRNYVIENGAFKTLEQKAEDNPEIRKLYGAPFIYLWGDYLISAEDISWPSFRRLDDNPVTDYLLSFADRLENGPEFTAALKEIKEQDYVAEYQKDIICSYISQLLKQDGFWDPSVFTKSSQKLDSLLSQGYDSLNDTEKIQVHKLALSVNLPQIFTDAATWMDSSTVDLLHDLSESGINEAWIGLTSWEQAFAKPELVTAAKEQGYLIASYDSYHSIHEPGKEQWITARFNDPKLYVEATIQDKTGQKERGFQNVGRKLNPVLSLPAVRERMEDIMSNRLPFNSWFIDCDATGEIYDDYSPSHLTTQQEDLAARLERMAYIRDQYRLVIGSEGGNDFAASDIAFAHGIELKTFSWMDEDMKNNRDSEYYIGKYYNPKGGVAEHFSKQIPVKEQYYTVFVDPKYDIPLFKLVYNDSVITSYHWDWSTFKIQGASQDRMIREVLYNVPPLYHLDDVEWEKYKEPIVSHHLVWSPFSKQASALEMTDFTLLSEDGSVQKTVFGQTLTAVANFGDSPFEYETITVPDHSVFIQSGQESFVYTPSVN